MYNKFVVLLMLVTLFSVSVAFSRRLVRHHFVLADTSATSSADAPKSPLKAQLAVDMKSAMINKEKVKLAAVRAIQSAIKQKEVDERVEVNEEMAIAILSKLVKQRKESIKSFMDGGRPELAATEQEECDIILSYLPKQLDEDDIKKVVIEAIAKVGATTIKDMGKVVAAVKPVLQGKADMAAVSEMIKTSLNNINK